MSGDVPEFSRPVPLHRLGAEPFRQDIAATASERDALARRFDLIAFDRLSASVELAREAGGTILLRADFVAEFAQNCIVTLDPVPGALRQSFAVRYGPPEAEPDALQLADEAEPAFEPLAGEVIDIGEAVAQEVSLSLPPFPRSSEAVIDEDSAGGDSAEGPFAVLARLVRRDTH